MSLARSWAQRSNTIGLVPGAKRDKKQALRDILKQLPVDFGGQIVVPTASGVKQSVPADNLCANQLLRTALVRRTPTGQWVVTEAGSCWLEDANDVKLAEHIHANVKLFGELLANLEGEHPKAALLGLAEQYGLKWTSADQLYRRISWMEVLGLVEKWDTSRFAVTESGQSFLDRIDLVDADVARATVMASGSDDTQSLPDAGTYVTTIFAGFSPQQLHKRKAIIGYIPRGNKAPDRDVKAGSRAPFDAVRTLVDILGQGASTEDFYERCSNQLGLKKTSASQTLQSMKHMGLFDMTGFNRYAVDPDVNDLLTSGHELDFVRYLHSRYKFIGELLVELNSATPSPQLSKIAAEHYGLQQIDNSEVRTRLGFMLDANLVERVDWTRYRATSLGKALAQELPLEERYHGAGWAEKVSAQDVGGVSEPRSVQAVVSALREYSRRSDASEDFEIAVADAFRYLGFHSKHLGGSGRTDVLLDAHLPDDGGYRVVVDAKASASGVITDNHIKFDALKDHQKKHSATYGLVVGPEFADRVREWAASNNFTLLTVEELEFILSRHVQHPLTLTDLRVLFQRSGDDLTDVDEQYAAAARSAAVLVKLVELLYAEAVEEDPLMNGYISLENINYALRKELFPRPSSTAVEEALQFLSHDLVRGAIRSGSKYKLADAPLNVMRRLTGLGIHLDKVATANPS